MRSSVKWRERLGADQRAAYSFVASGTSSTLTFASTTGSGYGAVIDNVKVTETLATGATCKKAGWATMHDNLGNSFKNQGDCVQFTNTGK